MLKTIYFAGGCFWGTQHLFSLVPGVTSTQTGYANSILPNPSYEQVCTGLTKAAETVKVDYDTDLVSLPELIDLFVQSIDPNSLNRQGVTQARNTAPASITLIRAMLLWWKRQCEPLMKSWMATAKWNMASSSISIRQRIIIRTISIKIRADTATFPAPFPQSPCDGS